MPLASLVQVPFLAVLGPTAIGFGTAVRADRLRGGADDVGGCAGRQASASVAIGAGLLVAIPVMSVVYMAQPDNFSLFQPLVLGALWMGPRGSRGRQGHSP